MTKSVIWEIADLNSGVPKGRLKEELALLKPFGRAVFARADPSSYRALHEEGLGVGGFVLPAPGGFAGSKEEVTWLLSASQSFGRHKGTFIAASLSSTSALPMAGVAGFTHATLRS